MAKKLRPDVNEIAFRTLQAATGEIPKPLPAGAQAHPEATVRGRAGGKKGGKARARSLSRKRRTSIAKKAARARWRREEG